MDYHEAQKIEAQNEKDHKALMKDKYVGNDLPDSVVDLIYNRAYQLGHSYGYSEVEYHFGEVLEFCIEVRQHLIKEIFGGAP